MKKIGVGLSLLIGALPCLVSAQILQSNDFETGLGDSILSNSAYATWTGVAESAIITNVIYSDNLTTPFMGTPLPPEVPHNNVLTLSDGVLTNTLVGSSDPVVCIDTMIQPYISEDPQTGTTYSNSQFAIAFVTNGVAVWHGVQPDHWTTGYARWSVLNGGTTAGSYSKWCRLTVTINYQGLPFSFGAYNPMFQVKIDGQPLTSPYGYVNADMDSGTNGSWLSLTSVDPANMSELIMSGNGMMDDLVINAGEIPDFVTPTNHIPYNWLFASGVDTNAGMASAESADDDHDGMLNWQEYIAGTSPTNANSKFMIISEVISTNGMPQLTWLGHAIAPYRIESATNLTDGSWADQNVSIVQNGTGTNSWSPMIVPANNATFYRVKIIR